MATLQVRSIDEQLYKTLARKAARENRSISQEVIAMLKQHLSQPADHASGTEQFLKLCGSWQDKRSAEEIIAEIRQSRRSRSRYEIEF